MPESKLLDLIDLAREPSSDRRRELLREVTDLFMAQPSARLDPSQLGLFDDVMSQLAGEMEEVVRAELSHRLAAAPSAPPRLLGSLARDSMAVAEPLLRTSRALSEADLVQLARTQGQNHLRAISQRPVVPTAVSDVIVERADDATLDVLLRNQGAELSREASETAVDRAQNNPALHAAVVERASLPPDLLSEMYFVVEARLRETIMARNATLDPAELQAALEAGRKRIAARDGALPADYETAEAEVRALALRGELKPAMLTGYLRLQSKTKLAVALAELAEIDFSTARRVLEGGVIDALAILCKAAGFDRALFLTLTIVMLNGEASVMAKAQEYGSLYEQLTRDAAQRAVRFWRLRRQAEGAANAGRVSERTWAA